MKGLRILLITTCLLGLSMQLMAQKDEQKESPSAFEEFFWWGANAGLQFSGGTFNGQSNSVFSISLEPMLGYKLDKRGNFSVGPRISLEYLSFTNFQLPDRVNSLNFGGGLFARAKVYRGYFAHVEYEKINQTVAFTDGTTAREWADNYFIGGGVNSGNGRTGFEVVLLYNLNPESVNFDQSPVEYRVGFNVNF